MPRQRGGNLVILKPANYTADPTRFASSDAKVSGRGCAGTKSNVAVLADSRASLNGKSPIFSPLAPISITSSALIFSLIGVIFFFEEAIRIPTN